MTGKGATTAMQYRLNPEALGSIIAVPSAVVEHHLKLAGAVQLKVLLWTLCRGQGTYDAAACAQAIGVPAADCSDALQFWFATGILLPSESNASGRSPAVPAAAPTPAPVKPAASVKSAPPSPADAIPRARPRAVKPQMKEVIQRQKQSAEFAYLLDTASARLGKPISPGDMETLLYLFDTAGLPVEVILMVFEYALANGKYSMRYIEKVALDWADRGIDTIAQAEQYLCSLERRRQSWEKVSGVLGLTQSPTVSQSDAAERWIADWQTDDGLLRLAYEKCARATGKFNSGYITKILEQWRMDGIDTVDKALAESEKAKGKGKATKSAKPTSFDLDEYESMVSNFTPVYQK